MIFALLMLIGCGGSGDGGSDRTGLTIVWKARGRTVVGPASAGSARVSVTPESGGESATAVANRPPDSSVDQSQQIDLQGAVPSGDARVYVEFYSGLNASGQIVGTADGIVRIDGGTVIGTISTVGKIDRVEVVKNQSVHPGETTRVAVSVYGESDEIIAIANDAYLISQKSGNGEIETKGNSVTGRRRGVAQIAATVDGVTSREEEFAVSPIPMTYLVEPLGGGAGITFLNDLSADGTTAVGSSRSGGEIVPFTWTRDGGSKQIPGLNVYNGANVATCVNGDGTIVGGVNSNDNESASAPWVWRKGAGTTELPVPGGFSSATVADVTDDGTILVGTAFDAQGKPWCLRWVNGFVSTAFQGEGNCVAPDGSAVGGSITLENPTRKVGFVWQSGGYFLETTGIGTNVALSSVYGLSEGYTFAAGNVADAPGFWTPGTGPVLVNGTITTLGQCVSRDGQLMGITGGDPWLAMLFTRKTGLSPLGRYFDQVKASGGPDLVKPFTDANCGPAEVQRISDDRMSICGTAYPEPGGAVRGYVTDYSGFRKL